MKNVVSLFEYINHFALPSAKESLDATPDHEKTADLVAAIYCGDKIARLIVDLIAEMTLRGFDSEEIESMLYEEFTARLG